MPKVSRPVVYTLLASVIIYVVFDLTTPPPPTPTRHIVPFRTSAPAANDVGLAAQDSAQTDLTVHFSRFRRAAADPFLPKVLPTGSRGKADVGKDAGKWTLTGIYAINGPLHALVENPVTGETASLQPGDHWRGLRVASINANAVKFENALGQQTELVFPQPSAPAIPQGLGPLPPMPVAGPLRPLPPLQSVPLPANNPGTHP